MQGPGRPEEDHRDGFRLGGRAAAAHDLLLRKVIGERPGGSWSLLLGRSTYEDFASFWPNQPPNPYSEALSKVEKFVSSNTLAEPLPWQNSALLRGDAAEAVARLKNTHEKSLAIMGSGTLVQSLMQHDLIDEYVVQVHHLFTGGCPLTKLRLVDLVTTSTGVIIATYHPIGAQ